MAPTNDKQCKLILENDHLSNSGKIQLISEIIENEDRPEHLLEHYKNRAILYYEEQKFNEVLRDVHVLCEHGGFDETLFIIKWNVILSRHLCVYVLFSLPHRVSTIYVQMEEICQSILKSLNVEMVEKVEEAVELFNCINDVKRKLIKRNCQKQLYKKVKRLGK